MLKSLPVFLCFFRYNCCMQEKSLKILEFDKVLSFLSEYAISDLGKERCLNAVIFENVNAIKHELALTSQARYVITNALNVPLDNIYDVEKSLEDARKRLCLNE